MIPPSLFILFHIALLICSSLWFSFWFCKEYHWYFNWDYVCSIHLLFSVRFFYIYIYLCDFQIGIIWIPYFLLVCLSISFSYLFTMAKISSSILIKSGGNGHPCLFTNGRGNAFSFSLFKDVDWKFFINNYDYMDLFSFCT